MALQPSPPTSPQQLHGLTGSPPRRGVNKSLSPLSSRVAATLSAQTPASASADGTLPLAPAPPAARPPATGSPRSPIRGARAPREDAPAGGTSVYAGVTGADGSASQPEDGTSQKLHEAGEPEGARPEPGSSPTGPEPGLLSLLPDEVLDRIAVFAEPSLPQLAAACRRFRRIVTRRDFDPLWLGLCASLLGDGCNFRALHSFGATRQPPHCADAPVWRAVACELRTGRLFAAEGQAGAGQRYAVHPAALHFAGGYTSVEEAHYFSLLSTLFLGGSAASADSGSDTGGCWRHAPLRWVDDGEPGPSTADGPGSPREGVRTLVEEWAAPDRSLKIELQALAGPAQEPEPEPEQASEEPHRPWLSPVAVQSSRVIYRSELFVGEAPATERWEMSLSFMPRDSLYLLHFCRSTGSDGPEEAADERLDLQLGSWYEIVLEEEKVRHDMYPSSEGNPAAELQLYLESVASFAATALERFARLREAAVATVAASTGSSGEALAAAKAAVDAVDRWVEARQEAVRRHAPAFHAALCSAWELLQP